MNLMCRPLLFALTICLCVLASAARAGDPKGLDALLSAYATKPHGYPAGKQFAWPDTSTPFRWHHFHDGAIERFEDAKMLPHVDPYNPLEGEGVQAEPQSGVKVQWTQAHRTEGILALQITVPAAAIRAGNAIVRIRGIAGGQSFSEYLRARNLMNTASCYGPHYRWIKLDAFNPSDTIVRIKVAGVPFLLPIGASTISPPPARRTPITSAPA